MKQCKLSICSLTRRNECRSERELVVKLIDYIVNILVRQKFNFKLIFDPTMLCKLQSWKIFQNGTFHVYVKCSKAIRKYHHRAIEIEICNLLCLLIPLTKKKSVPMNLITKLNGKLNLCFMHWFAFNDIIHFDLNDANHEVHSVWLLISNEKRQNQNKIDCSAVFLIFVCFRVYTKC